jgi:hypothetical protein
MHHNVTKGLSGQKSQKKSQITNNKIQIKKGKRSKEEEDQNKEYK